MCNFSKQYFLIMQRDDIPKLKKKSYKFKTILRFFLSYFVNSNRFLSSFQI